LPFGWNPPFQGDAAPQRIGILISMNRTDCTRRKRLIKAGRVPSEINLEVDSDDFVEKFARRYIPVSRVGNATRIATVAIVRSEGKEIRP
jgi:hypothetical protein